MFEAQRKREEGRKERHEERGDEERERMRKCSR